MKFSAGFGRPQLISVLTLSALLVVTVFVVVPIQRALEVRMAAARDEVIEALEDRIGRRVSYSRISPSIFRYLDIRDLTIHGSEGEADVLASFGRVKAYFSVERLISGDAANAVSEIRFEQTSISLHHERDADLVRLIRSLGEDGGASGHNGLVGPDLAEALRSRRLVIRGENVAVVYDSGDAIHSATGLFFRADLSPTETEVSLRGTVSHSVAGTNSHVRAENVSLTGSFAPGGSPARLTVEIPHLWTPVVSVRDQIFQIDLDEQRVSVRKIRDRSPIDISLIFDPAERRIDVAVIAEEIVPADILRLDGALSVFNGWLLGETTGRASLTYLLDSRDVQYDVTLQNRVRNPEVPEPILLTVTVDGDQRLANVRELVVRSSEGSAQFRGSVDVVRGLPEGQLALDQFTYGEIRSTTAEVAVTSSPGGISLDAPWVSYGASRFYDVAFTTGPLGGDSSFFATAFLDEEQAGRVSLAGNMANGTTLDVTAEFRRARLNRPLAVAADLLPAVSAEIATRIPASLILDTRVAVRITPDGFSVEAPFVSVFDEDREDRFAAFALFAEDGEIVVSDGLVGWDSYLLQGGFSASVGRRGGVDFAANIFDGDRTYELNGLVDRDRTVVFTGSHGLDGRVHLTRTGDAVFSVRGNEIPVPFSTTGAAITMDVGGMFRTPTDWNAQVRNMMITGIRVGDRVGDVAFAGRMGPNGATLDSVTISDDISVLSGSGTVSYRFDGAGPIALEMILAADGTGERYEVQGILDGGEVTAALVVERTPLARTRVAGIRGSVNGIVTIDGPIANPWLTMDFQVMEAALNNDAFNANGRISFREGVLQFDAIRGQFVTTQITAGRGVIDMYNGSIDLQATIRNTARPRAGPRTLRVRSDLVGADGSTHLVSLLRGPFAGDLRIDGLDVLPERYGDWVFSVQRHDEGIDVFGGPQNAMSLSVQTNGQFRAVVQDRLPISFVAAGTVRDRQIEANVMQVMIRIDEVPDLLDFTVVEVSSGVISGGVRLVGPLNDPDFYGTLTADGVHARVEYVPATIGPAKLFLVFQEKELGLTRFETGAGRGRAALTGTFVLNRWSVDEFALDIETNETGVPVAHTFGTLMVDGVGVGRMRIAGGPGVVSITGDIEARATTLAVNPRAESQPASGQTMANVDLTLRTGRRVEFLWPSRDFPVVRSFAQTNQRLRLQYSDDAGTFRLRGDVGIQGGEIYYFDRSFYIREGTIAFDETEEQFDPRLSARAELREVGSRGPVRIYLIADGSRLSEFSPRFESSPTMTDAEIVALIGGGLITGTADDVVNLSTAMLATTELVTPLGIMNRVESGIRDALGLDLFSVRTQFFQNLVLRALDDPRDQDDPLDNTSPSLGKYFDNTTVFLGKYLGSSLFLELLFQMRARNPLESEVQSIGGVDVDSEIGLEFQTPFFLLQWRMLPQNPQNLFVTDTTFTFSWGFSY
ncbi:MAG: hypothetical protein EA403_12080 [Spirochaetaceae bacterium]|nr:MAG: hypothetical protein EA403_12080 [Spirochaetaceae bacterium]